MLQIWQFLQLLGFYRTLKQSLEKIQFLEVKHELCWNVQGDKYGKMYHSSQYYLFNL